MIRPLIRTVYTRFSVLQSNVGLEYDTQTCSIQRQAYLTPQTEIIGYNVSFMSGTMKTAPPKSASGRPLPKNAGMSGALKPDGCHAKA
ncbi:MAG: hypothetical protein R2875_14035 [Desulfobacterales bacterium]